MFSHRAIMQPIIDMLHYCTLVPWLYGMRKCFVDPFDDRRGWIYGVCKCLLTHLTIEEESSAGYNIGHL